jgi:hypothetical protein
MTNEFGNETFRSSNTQSKLAIGFLAAVLVGSVLFAIFSLVILAAPDAQIDLGNGDSLYIGLGLMGITAMIRTPLFIATIVLFLIWEHRAFSNLTALRAQNQEFSPGWAVGWWFIPFANLVKPFQAMRELWSESDPDFDPELGLFATSYSAPRIMAFWWAAWIIGNIFINFTSSVTIARDFAILQIISSFFEIIAGALLIKLILDITKRQELRYRKLSATEQNYAPPSPPDFNDFQS